MNTRKMKHCVCTFALLLTLASSIIIMAIPIPANNGTLSNVTAEPQEHISATNDTFEDTSPDADNPINASVNETEPEEEEEEEEEEEPIPPSNDTLADAAVITDTNTYSPGEQVNISLLSVPPVATVDLMITSPSSFIYIALEEETGLYSFTETTEPGEYTISANLSLVNETKTLTKSFDVIYPSPETEEIPEDIFDLNNASLVVDKPMYAPGETVHIYLSAPPEVIANFSITSPTGIKYLVLPSASGDYEFKPDTTGNYVINASLRADNAEKFLSAEFEVSDLNLEIVFGDPVQSEITIGDPVNWSQSISITNHDTITLSDFSLTIPLPADYSNLSFDAGAPITFNLSPLTYHPPTAPSLSLDLAAGETVCFTISYQTPPVLLEVTENCIDISDLIPLDAFDIEIYEEIGAEEPAHSTEIPVKQVEVWHNSSLHYHDIPVTIEAEGCAQIVELAENGAGIEKEITVEQSEKTTSWTIPKLSNKTYAVLEVDRTQDDAEIDKPVEWQLNVSGTIVTYKTPAPYKTEYAPVIKNGKWQKEIVISSNASVHYSNVTAYSDLDETEKYNLRLFWLTNGSRIDVTHVDEFNVSFLDTSANGFTDFVTWTVPQLSNQSFEVVADITVINVQSYPAVGGNWTVRFETTGTANLTITAVNGTTWTNQPYECYDEETEILTKVGWKLFKDLKPEEEVLTLNQETKAQEWQKPIKNLEYDYSDAMFEITLADGSQLLVSPEHKVYGAINSNFMRSLFNSNTLNGLPLLISAENTTLASTTNNISNHFSRSLLAIAKLTSSANSLACSSVSFDLETIASSSLISSSSLLRNLENNNCQFSSETLPSSIPISSGTLTTISAISSSNNKTNLLYLNNFSMPVTVNEKETVTNTINPNGLNTYSLLKISDLYELSDKQLVFLDSEQNPVVVKKIEKVPYTGKIYAVTVQNRILLVRRGNSTPVWCGNSNYDLQFLELKCGNQTLNYRWINNSIFIQNYECNETGYEISKVLTAGSHHLKFQFGSDVEYAHNWAGEGVGVDLNKPENNSFTSANWTILNATVYTNTTNNMTVYFYANNNSNGLNASEGLVYAAENVANETTLTYNLTALPIKPSEDGLVLLMHFDNRSEYGENYTHIYDFSGTGNNGSCSGIACPAYNLTGGRFGGAYHYDGSQDYLTIPDNESLDITTNLSIEAWVNFDSLGSSSDFKGIVTKWDGRASNSGWGYGLFKATGDGDIAFITSQSGGGGYEDARSNVPPTLGVWYHVVGTHNGSLTSNQMRLYINGVLQSNTATQSSINTNNFPVTIGDFEPTNSFYFHGRIDEIAIYNRTLSQEEVLTHYELGDGKYYWKVNASDGVLSNESNVREFTVATQPVITTYTPAKQLQIQDERGAIYKQSYPYLQKSRTLNASAILSSTDGVGGVRFIVDQGEAGEAIVNDTDTSDTLFSAQFSSLCYGNHTLDITILDGIQNPLSGPGQTESIDPFWIVPYIIQFVGDSITISYADDTTCDVLNLAAVTSGCNAVTSENSFELPCWDNDPSPPSGHNNYSNGIHIFFSDYIKDDYGTYIFGNNEAESGITASGTHTKFQNNNNGYADRFTSLDENSSNANLFGPTHAYVMLGLNDKRTGVTEAEYEANLTKVVNDTHNQSIPYENIILLYPTYSPTYDVSNYLDNIDAVSNNLGTKLITDLYNETKDNYDNHSKSWYHTDNLHFTRVGSQNISRIIAEKSTWLTTGEATYTEFSGSETTDFNNLPDITNVSGATLHIVTTAKITWYNNVNAYGADFDTNVDCGFAFVNVNASGLNSTFNSSANVTLYSLSWSEIPVIFEDGSPCPDCQLNFYSGGNLSFNVTHFTNYSAGANANLTIWDDTDPEGGSQTKYPGNQIKFYANYTNITSGQSINGTGVYCNISFNVTPNGPFGMTFNSSSLLYEYNRSFSSSGTFNWNVTGNGSAQGYEELNVTDTVTISTSNNYIPPDPTSLANSTGNFWVNYTWNAGSGNVTDSFNVSMNGTWTNDSALTYMNVTVGSGGWANITVYAYNTSGVGTLSTGSISQNTQIPGPTWLSGWLYRMPIEINNTGNVLTYYQYNFTVDTASLVAAGKMNANGSDCRITSDDNYTLQPFWNETSWNNSSTMIWVNATELGNVTNTTHYMYYGNSSASDISNGNDTFDFFDNFEDLVGWTDVLFFSGSDYSTSTIVNNHLHIVVTNGGNRMGACTDSGILSKNQRVEAKVDGRASTGDINTVIFHSSQNLYENDPCVSGDYEVWRMYSGTGVKLYDNVNEDDVPTYPYAEYRSNDYLYFGSREQPNRANIISNWNDHNYRWGIYSYHAGTLDVDWVFVRQFNATEPSTSIGSEERETITTPNPTNLLNTTGNFWVNYTWNAGSGNVTDSFNVSMNGTWTNDSALTYMNVSVGSGGWANITVWAWNASGTGTLSAGCVSDEVQAPEVLICTCGDFCVNGTGWWRNNGVFNASSMQIQAAVDNASSGETIYVYNGSYSENVNVTKQLSLQGEGTDVVNVTNSTADSHVFNVTANYVNISGFNVTGATGNMKAGIYIGNGVDHCNISDNIGSNNYIGIYLNTSSSNNLFANNTISDNTWDLHIKSSASSFTNNTLNGTTVSLTYSGNVSLKGVGSPASDPAGWNNLTKFINATNQSAGAWMFLNFTYSDADVSGLDESSLKVWKYNGTAWVEDGWNGSRYLDAANNVVGVNITSFSVFAPMGSSGNPPVVTLNRPENGSIIPNNWAILNATVTDADNDNMTVYFYANNNSNGLNASEGLVYIGENVANGTTLTYNLTALPIKPSEDELVLLMHFDNRNEFGEHTQRNVANAVYDFSGNGNNGTLGNATAGTAPTWNVTGGKFAGAFEFDGTDDYITVSDDPSLRITGPLTVEAWVNFNNLGDYGSYIGLVSKWDYYAYGFGYGIFKEINSNRLSFHLSSTGSDNVWIASDNDPSVDTWYHVVGTFNGSVMLMYVNGVLQSNTSNEISSIVSNANPVTIGSFEVNNKDFWFNGTIDEVAIYNRSLSAEEILNHYRLAEGKYYWKVNATDGVLSNESEVWEFTVVRPDLRIINVTFDDWDTTQNRSSVSETGTGYHVKENKNITINATIANYGLVNVTSNFNVSFFDSAGVYGNWSTCFWNSTYNVSTEGELGNTTTGYPYNTTYVTGYWNPSLIGTHNISVWANPDNSAGESAVNTTNNNGSALINVSAWQKYWGNVTKEVVLADSAGHSMINWSWDEVIDAGYIYTVNKDVSVNWSALHGLGCDNDNTLNTSGNDFSEADTALNLKPSDNNATGFVNNNITELFCGGNPNTATNTSYFVVYGMNITNVSIVNSTYMTNHTDAENANFSSGILWDFDSGNGANYYDGTQELVFITKVRAYALGLSGVSEVHNYEIGMPCSLNPTIGGYVDFYVELA